MASIDGIEEWIRDGDSSTEPECGGVVIAFPSGCHGGDLVLRFSSAEAMADLFPSAADLLTQLPEGSYSCVHLADGDLMLGVTRKPIHTEDQFHRLIVANDWEDEVLAKEVQLLEEDRRQCQRRAPQPPQPQFLDVSKAPQLQYFGWKSLGKIALAILSALELAGAVRDFRESMK